jgi:hypothetical protein
MNITQISNLLGVDKSFTYRIIKQFPNEVPRSRDYLAEWEAFILRHRIEATGDLRVPRSPSHRVASSIKSTKR